MIEERLAPAAIVKPTRKRHVSCLKAKVVDIAKLNYTRSTLVTAVSILSDLGVVTNTVWTCMTVAWTPRAWKTCRGKWRKTEGRARKLTPPWPSGRGSTQQEHLARESQSSIMRRDGKHESTCLGVMSATAHPRRGGELFFAPSQSRRRCCAAAMIQVSSHATAHCLRVLSVSPRTFPPPPLLFFCPH